MFTWRVIPDVRHFEWMLWLLFYHSPVTLMMNLLIRLDHCCALASNNMNTRIFWFITLLGGTILFNGCSQSTPAQKKFKEVFARAGLGDAAAQTQLGLLYVSGDGVERSDTEAFKWFRKAADQNNPVAQFNLAVSYTTGEGVARDAAEAIKWFRKAAEQNHADAQFNLGVAYAQGELVPKNLSESVRWFLGAAKQNHSEAQSKLAFMYASGSGTSRDVVRAHAWWNVAIASGDPDARKNLDTLEKEMSPQQVNMAVALARELSQSLKMK